MISRPDEDRSIVGRRNVASRSEALLHRLMEPGEETAVCDLVIRVFDEVIAPHYSQEGVVEFLKYVQPDLLLRRSQTDHFVLLAATQDEIVGMIEVRDNSHICLLFVDKRFQGKGISRALLRRSLEICRGHRPDLRELSVNSSPNSVHIYQKLGFRHKSSEQVKNGIRFTPMVLELTNP